MDHKKRLELQRAADELLLRDGKAFYEGTVRGAGVFTRVGDASPQTHRNRKRKDVIYDAIGRYEALDPTERRILRKRYQQYNPDKSRSMLDWQHWLVEYFDGIPKGEGIPTDPNRTNRPAIP